MIAVLRAPIIALLIFCSLFYFDSFFQVGAAQGRDGVSQLRDTPSGEWSFSRNRVWAQGTEDQPESLGEGRMTRGGWRNLGGRGRP